MNKYLIILNWLMAGIAVLIFVYLRPVFGTAIFIGSIVGGMLSAGFISWRYYKDHNKDKSVLWQSTYFRKDYLREILIQTGLTLAVISFSLLFWHSFLSFIGGVMTMFLMNIIIEYLWVLIVRRNK